MKRPIRVALPWVCSKVSIATASLKASGFNHRALACGKLEVEEGVPH